MKIHRLLKAGLIAGLVVWVGPVSAQTRAVLIYNDTPPAIQLAAAELKTVLKQKNLFAVVTASPALTPAPTDGYDINS
jgi:hypothetical protein